ncbi:imidazole glycerol phosphate synthase subunit HisF [Arcobacter peruensis]|uniref:imidazole glycerol phosphate synthase subunit HisF n=1 Tax=Arcobacter peruensis TaxID=2320140 RepID=UPI000F086CF8|nr:imidazole glycerol phosphate synthase cyclase subunit [Arcobacter peruensis]
MNKKRVISRIDVKNEFVVKGIQLEGLRKLGNPNELALKYYDEGIDEIIFMDAVAAYYDRNSLSHIIEMACENIFVPITVGGGIRKEEDIKELLNVGADKVAINTQAVKDPSFLTKMSKVFGSQCIVSSIVAKKIDKNKWEVYIDNGREPTGLDAIEWAKEVEKLGVGEILVTSVDKDGTKKGFDLELNEAISSAVSIPTIASSGAGNKKDVLKVLKNEKIDAAAIASVLHYNIETLENIKGYCNSNGVLTR